jgi:hypothetical protein
MGEDELRQASERHALRATSCSPNTSLQQTSAIRGLARLAACAAFGSQPVQLAGLAMKSLTSGPTLAAER